MTVEKQAQFTSALRNASAQAPTIPETLPQDLPYAGWGTSNAAIIIGVILLLFVICNCLGVVLLPFLFRLFSAFLELSK